MSKLGVPITEPSLYSASVIRNLELGAAVLSEPHYHFLIRICLEHMSPKMGNGEQLR